MSKPSLSLRTLVIYSNLLGLLLLAGALLYHEHQVAADQPWLVYQDVKMPVLQSAVQMGEPVSLSVKRCNRSKIERIYNFSSKLVSDTDPDAPAITIATQPESIDIGCKEIRSDKNIVPKNIPPGRYHVHGLSVVPTPYHVFNVPWDSESFDVVAPEPKQ